MLTEVAVIDAHGKHAQAVRFTHDGKLLVSTGQDANVRLWSVPSFAAAGAFAGHKNSVNSLSFSPDERLLATGSTDGTVRVWSFPDGQCLHTLAKQTTGVFSPDGKQLATISAKGQIVFWEVSSGRQIDSIGPFDKRTICLAFSPDGADVLLGGAGPIHRVKIATGEKQGEMTGHAVVVACLRVSPDGKRLASTGADGQLRLWSTKDWSLERAVKIGACGVLQIAFAADSKSVAVAADHLLQIFSVKTGAVLDRIESPLKGLYGVAISPDGEYLANAAADGRIRIWRR